MAQTNTTQTSTSQSTSTQTATSQTTTSSQTNTSQTTTSLPIVDAILADVNAVIPNFSSLVASYRLLVGSAEEIRRIQGVPPEIFKRAVVRFDRAGTLIDILLELLCCKITFSSDFLSITCAPVDIFRDLATCDPCNTDTPCRTAEQIVLLEVIRQSLEKCGYYKPCFPPEDYNIQTPPEAPPTPPTTPVSPAPPPPAPASPPEPQSQYYQDSCSCPKPKPNLKPAQSCKTAASKNKANQQPDCSYSSSEIDNTALNELLIEALNDICTNIEKESRPANSSPASPAKPHTESRSLGSKKDVGN